VSHPAVFFDRDGVLMYDTGYVSSPEQVTLLPNAASVVTKLREAGFWVVVVTNQSGIGRGFFTHDEAAAVADRLTELLAEQGAWVDATYCCPHSPEDDCECRKPKPGMLHRAARELDLDLSRSFMIGDRLSDCQAAQAAGCQPIFLSETGSALGISPPCIVISELVQLPGLIQSLACSKPQMEVADERQVI
jgi:D-glycero-D-manno-heptose 1,7-bisphosphate phosphatase